MEHPQVSPYPECESCYDLWCQLRDAKEALAKLEQPNQAESKLVEALIEIAAADNLKAWKLREIADKAVQEYEEKTK